MNVFIFIFAIVANSGELTLYTNQVEACPDKDAFVSRMEDLKAKGEIKDWDANCVMVPATKEGQSI